MTFGLELAGAFVAGIGFTLVMLAVLAKPLMRWSMKRMMSGMVATSIVTSTASNATDVKVDLNP